MTDRSLAPSPSAGDRRLPVCRCPAWRTVAFALGAVVLASPVYSAVFTPILKPGAESDWRMARGKWTMRAGEFEQTIPDRLSCALLKTPAFRDVTLSVEFNVRPVGRGVRAAALCFGASGTLTYYWLHLDTRNNNVILVRSTPGNSWGEIMRRHCRLDDDAWVPVRVECRGKRVRVEVNGKTVLETTLPKPAAGRIGLGSSQGRVVFRNLKLEGDVMENAAPLVEEEPPYRVISRGAAAGTYQAFPDACRLADGDILAVFYAGYGHVSLPNAEYPKGGRICMVRSSDDGRTWSEPVILFDDEMDNRDPHVAQMSDGAVICTFFSLTPNPKTGRWNVHSARMVRSTDGGKTWETKARSLCPDDWVCSAPVRELPDGTYILGVYSAAHHYGGVIRSTDRGKTWSRPIPIGKGSGIYLDAETDVIRLKDGTLYAALRSSRVDMHYATSTDEGLTWSKVKDIGFKGHAPHLYRVSTGEIVLTHRVPATAMHVSRDECRTWAGPFRIDTVGGAYPATVELKDGSLLVVYYEEGAGSAVRVQRIRLTPDGFERLDWK
ncbi:MAG: DUF1080 domain-containing protein [Kiritimatiellaeota bacterium]|nr:DUF1080 domain-containing protein [Kiritimatiellota bacterium]